MKQDEPTRRWRVLSLAARGGQFRSWLVAEYMRLSGGVPPNSKALSEALEGARALAAEGERRRVHLRVAEHEDAIYLDLGRRTLEAVEITAEGWRVVSDPPVEFWRSDGMGELPIPDGDVGDLARLEGLLNLDTVQELFLATAWLLGCLQAGVPYPVLVLLGEAGSAKSSATRLLRMLVDPAGPSGRAVSGPPREGRDLFAAALSRHVLAIDNLSRVPQWLSDLLSAIATGGGQDTRRMYTDADLLSVDARRPILMNGIEITGLGEDLVDRAIVLTLREPRRRVREREFWAQARDAWPAILGGLCDVASRALRHRDEALVPADVLPRMADFGHWVLAGQERLRECALFDGLDFLEIYRENRARTGESIIEASLVGPYVVQVAEEGEGWTGTTSELLAMLNHEPTVPGDAPERVPKRVRGLKGWPATAVALGKRLVRLAPALREAGYWYEREHGRGGTRVTLRRLAEGGEVRTISVQGQIPF